MKKLLFWFFIFALLIACNDKKEETTETPAPAAAAETKKTTDEILDMSETEGVKASLAAFANKDITGMTANYDDKVTMLWSNLDSLVGKQAVVDYYTNRFKIIDSLNFSEHILVPLKVNMQQSQYAPTGKWVLAWVFAHVKYTNGKKLNFWVHNVYHYNDGGKIDFVGQYLDRQPIAEATKGLVK